MADNMTWTSEQKQVIDLRDRSLLVSAAAGSGKTAVLVQRIIERICDESHPVDIDRLLVVTFTNAAAGEMRERVQAAIAKRVEENPDNTHLRRQEVLAGHAHITTIDSFCFSPPERLLPFSLMSFVRRSSISSISMSIFCVSATDWLCSIPKFKNALTDIFNMTGVCST